MNSRFGSVGWISAIAARLILPVLCWFAPGAVAQQAGDVPPPEAVLKRLPEDWRGPVAKLWKIQPGSEAAYLSTSEAVLPGSILNSLTAVPGAEEFILAHLNDPIVSKLYRSAVIANACQEDPEIWASNPHIDGVLEKIIESDPDHEMAMTALESLRSLRMYRLRKMLDDRLAQQQRSGASPVIMAKLEEQDERWVSLLNGTMLPSFLRQPPPVFTVLAQGQKIRVAAIGDFGVGDDNQKQVARAMREYHKQKPFDFGITLGDNFYEDGMHSLEDPRWKTWWEDLYGPMGIRFYAALGNHDYYDPDSPAAEVLYGRTSATWTLPSTYYTYLAGAVQFFVIDTGESSMSELQLHWLKDELDKSRAPWKIVYGHYPPYIVGQNGTNTTVSDLGQMTNEVMPILKGRADAYLAGHVHTLQHVKAVDGVNLFVIGAGGRGTGGPDVHSQGIWSAAKFGFAVLEADQDSLTVRFIGKSGEVLDESTVRK